MVTDVSKSNTLGIVRYFRGDLTLAMTYWPGVIVLALVAQFVAPIANNLYLSPTLGENTAVALHLVMLACLIAAQALVLRAVYRAGTNNRSLGVWGSLGVVGLCVGLAMMVYSIFILLVPGAPMPRSWIEDDIASLNASLPAVVEEDLILREVRLRGDVITWVFFANWNVVPSDRDYYAMTDWQSEPEHVAACNESVGYFRSGITDIETVWEFGNETITGRMSAQACLDLQKSR